MKIMTENGETQKYSHNAGILVTPTEDVTSAPPWGLVK